jgi:hypothetical protein
MSFPRSFPDVLRDLHKLEFDYADGEGIDFEPYQEFMAREEVQDWFKAWTGNPNAICDDYLIFGQDGTGGYAAIWPIQEGKTLLEQPIVFFGSEGELGVVASNFADYLWVLAGNLGPYEAIAYPDNEGMPNTTFLPFAKSHATTAKRKVSEILQTAQSEFSEFKKNVYALCG